MKIWKDFRRACVKHNRLVKKGKRKYFVEPWHLIFLIGCVPLSSFIIIISSNLMWYWKVKHLFFEWRFFFENCAVIMVVYTIYAIYIWKK